MPKPAPEIVGGGDVEDTVGGDFGGRTGELVLRADIGM